MAAVSSPPRVLWWVAARSGFMAAVAGTCTAVVIAVLCWLPDAGVSGKPASAIRAGLLSFLAAHHGGITVDGVKAGFLPLAMLLAVIGFAWRAGATIADALDSSADAGTADAGAPDEITSAQLCGALALATLAYFLVCEALVPMAQLGTSHVSRGSTGLAAFVVFALAAGASLARRTNLLEPLTSRLPDLVVTAARGAAAAWAVYLGAGALLTVGSLVLHAHRVTELSRQVGGGFSGLPVLVIGLACVPNAAIAGSAYLAGPGFAVGSGTAVNAFSTSHGLLPALPLLGAVPDGNGANPLVLALMCLVALAAAACSARCVRRVGPVGFPRQAGAALVSGLACGLAMGITCWLGGGPAGAGRLRVVGASPWRITIAIALVVGVLGVLVVGVLTCWDLLMRSSRSGPSAEDVSRRELAGSSTR
jgi:hypothetical protein